MEFKRETRPFEVPLTEIEINGKDRAAREKLLAGEAAEQERLGKVSEATELRKRVKGLDADARKLARTAADGKEKRDVVCEWRPDPNAPRMNLHRLDIADGQPGQIVDGRPMYRDEEKRYGRTVSEPPASADGGAPKAEDKAAKTVECIAVLARNADEPVTAAQRCGKPASKRHKKLCGDHRGASGDMVAGWVEIDKQIQLAQKTSSNGAGNGHAADVDASGEPDALRDEAPEIKEPPVGVEARV